MFGNVFGSGQINNLDQVLSLQEPLHRFVNIFYQSELLIMFGFFVTTGLFLMSIIQRFRTQKDSSLKILWESRILKSFLFIFLFGALWALNFFIMETLFLCWRSICDSMLQIPVIPR